MYDSEEQKSVQSTIFTGIDLQSTSAAQDPIGRMSSGSIGYAVAALGNRLEGSFKVHQCVRKKRISITLKLV